MFYLSLSSSLLQSDKCIACIRQSYRIVRRKNYLFHKQSSIVKQAKQRQIDSNLKQTRVILVQNSTNSNQNYLNMSNIYSNFEVSQKIWNFQSMITELDLIANQMLKDQNDNNNMIETYGSKSSNEIIGWNDSSCKEIMASNQTSPIALFKARMNANIKVMKPKQSILFQITSILQENKTNLYTPMQQRLLSTINNDIHSKVPIEQVAPTKQKHKEVTSHSKDSFHNLFPKPKYSLNHVFITLSQHFNDKSYMINPQYKPIHESKRQVFWECSFVLKWPNEMKFTGVGPTKQAASAKASTVALQHFYSNGLITSKSIPVFLEPKNNPPSTKEPKEVILFNADVMQNMQNIVDDYDQKLLKYLQYDSFSKDVDMHSVGSEEAWPVSKDNQYRFKFKGIQFYTCNEKYSLPIGNHKEEIIETVNSNRVVIIKGEPGCGKSTRVPQYILESWALNYKPGGKNCRIIVTQPRRLAAISLAKHVSSERGEPLGPTVGFQVRLKSEFDRHTGKILYCTSGILLRRLQSDPALTDCTYVVLDEAHERDVNTDLLLNLLKGAMAKNQHLKLLIMSATIKAEVFQAYFKEAAITHVPGFTYPVSVKFLGERCGLPATYAMAKGTTPNVVHEDIAKLIHRLHRNKPKGAILVFLPGWNDIVRVKTLIGNYNDMEVLCLHSRVPDDEQRRIYEHYPDNVRKVILATNIAETSITIDDVVYVIDSGIHKENRFDAEKGITIIDNHWISKASMAQRKGRAGRVQAGEAYLLYPETKFNEFSDYSIPEIQRTSLTKIVLDSKVYSKNMKAAEFLGQLITPPETGAVARAVQELTELGLLDDDENLTPLGRVLSEFQLEPKLAKALAISVIYKCVTPIVDIVTYFSEETAIFAGGLGNKDIIKSTKMRFSESSDHLAMMRLFEGWLDLVEDGKMREGDSFCMKHNLLPYKLRTLQQLREIYFGYLRNGLHDILPISDDNSDSDELVKAVLLSGVGTILHHRINANVGGKRKKGHALITRHDQRVSLSSESVNRNRDRYPTNYLLYINETRSNIRRSTVIRETSLITPLTTLLFMNKRILLEPVNVKDESATSLKDPVVVRLDGTRFAFLTERQQAMLLIKCKEALTGGVDYYIYQMTKGAEYDNSVNQIWDGILKSLNDCLYSQANNIAF